MRQDQLSHLLCSVLRQALAGSRRRVPEAARFLWDAFACLCATRTYGMAGPNPIGFAEIEAWARMHRLPIEERHVSVIRALDDVWLKHAYARQRRADAPPPSASQAVNPDAFDAVFG